MTTSEATPDRDVTGSNRRPSLITAVRNAVALTRGQPLLLGLFLLSGAASAVIVMLQRGRIVEVRGDILFAAAIAISLLVVLITTRYATVDPDATGVFRTQLKYAVVLAPLVLLVEILLVAGLYVVLRALPLVVSGVPLLVLSVVLILITVVIGVLLVPAITIGGHGPIRGVRKALRCLQVIPVTLIGTLFALGLVVFGLSVSRGALYGAPFAAVSGLLGIVNGLGLLVIGYLYANAPIGSERWNY